MFRYPGLGGSRKPQQQQRPIGGKRRNGGLDEPAVANILCRDCRAVLGRAAQQVGDDGLRRKQPVFRARPVVAALQRREFFGKELFSGTPQLGIIHED
jgi:hypothetical protein